MTNVEKDIFLMKLINRNDIIADKDGNVYRKKSYGYAKIGSLNKYSGYLMVVLRNPENNKRYNYKLHRIVYMFFNGLIDENLVINHIDGNKLNNKLENLEAVSQEYNVQHAFKNNLITIPNGIKNHNSTFKNQDEIKLIKKMYSENVKINDIAKHFNVSRRTISRIVHNRRYC